VIGDAHVQSVLQRDSQVEIVCSNRTYSVAKAIVASGAWVQKIFTRKELPFWVERQVQVWFPVDDPELYGPERFGVFIRHVDGLAWYGFPTLDRRTIKVAIHHGGDPSDPDRLDRAVRPSDVQPLAELVASQLHGVKATAVRSQVCMYTNTPDECFVIGPLPDADRVILAGPMGGHGFKFAPVVGRIAAQLATKGRADYPIEPFRPSRLADLYGVGSAQPPPAGA
jgi:sarcosine oxidase